MSQTIKTEVPYVEVHMNLFAQTPVPQYHTGLGDWVKGKGPERVLPTNAKVTLFLNGETPDVFIFGNPVNKDGTDDRRYNTRVMLIGYHEMADALAEQAQKFLTEPNGQVEA